MVDFAVRFNDFSGGSWGLTDPARLRLTPRGRVLLNRWQGRNVSFYRSGLLGVRPTENFYTVTGLPTAPVAPGPVGFTAIGGQLVVCLDKLYRLNVPTTDGGAMTLGTPYDPYPSGTPQTWMDFAVANSTLYSLADGHLYKHAGNTTVAITTPALFSQITRWNLFLVAADRAVPGRIWFTTVDPAGAHFDQWDANSYYDIDNTEPITALLPIFNTLYIGKRSGWWSVSGVLGQQAYVRQVALGVGPADARLATVTTDNRIAYHAVGSSPALFNGSGTFSPDNWNAATLNPCPSQGVIVSPTDGQVIYGADRGSDPNVLIYDLGGGRYELHDFGLEPPGAGTGLGGFAPTEVKDAYGLPAGVLWGVSKASAVGDPIHFYSWRSLPNDPGLVGDPYAGNPDAAGAPQHTSSVSLASWYDGQGRQIMVRALVVQFRKWKRKGGTDARNQIAVRVVADGAYERPPTSSEQRRWEEPMARSSVDGTDDSWRVGVGDQGWGNGFQVVFDELAGVALREVTVLCEVKNARVG